MGEGDGMCWVWEYVYEKERDTDRHTDRQNPGTDKEFLHGAWMEADKS